MYKMTNKEGMRFGYSCRNGKAVTTLTYSEHIY